METRASFSKHKTPVYTAPVSVPPNAHCTAPVIWPSASVIPAAGSARLRAVGVGYPWRDDPVPAVVAGEAAGRPAGERRSVHLLPLSICLSRSAPHLGGEAACPSLASLHLSS